MHPSNSLLHSCLHIEASYLPGELFFLVLGICKEAFTGALKGNRVVFFFLSVDRHPELYSYVTAGGSEASWAASLATLLRRQRHVTTPGGTTDGAVDFPRDRRHPVSVDDGSHTCRVSLPPSVPPSLSVSLPSSIPPSHPSDTSAAAGRHSCYLRRGAHVLTPAGHRARLMTGAVTAVGAQCCRDSQSAPAAQRAPTARGAAVSDVGRSSRRRAGRPRRSLAKLMVPGRAEHGTGGKERNLLWRGRERAMCCNTRTCY